MKTLEGKVALVTGAGSGIGKATALLFGKEGAQVAVVDRSLEKAHDTAAAIIKAGGRASALATDVSQAAECRDMVSQTLALYGHLDVAVNNAGIGGEMNTTAEYSIDGWQQIMSINLDGVFYCMKYEIPALLKSHGAIVNMASILGQVAFAGAPGYVAAKHGVVGLTKAAALELAPQGVRVNAVGPAFIETPMIAPVTADQAARTGLIAQHPIGRLGKPEEVAELVLWLSSNKASFVTGSYYPIDGGYLAR